MEIASAMRACTLSALIVSTLASAADAADALQAAEQTVNEYMLRSAIIITCHPVKNDSDIGYLGTAKAVGDAAFNQLWAQFDASDPSQHVENARKADEIIKRLIVEAERKAEQQLQEKGCAGLEAQLKSQN